MKENKGKAAKVVLVTGASSGIGMKAAQMLNLEGWSVVLHVVWIRWNP